MTKFANVQRVAASFVAAMLFATVSVGAAVAPAEAAIPSVEVTKPVR